MSESANKAMFVYDRLAEVIIDATEIALYLHGDSKPVRIKLTSLRRMVISLRDVDGPCVWGETEAEAMAVQDPPP